MNINSQELSDYLKQSTIEDCIKLVQYYEQSGNPTFKDNGLDVEGTIPAIVFPGYRALIELYIASNKEIPQKQLEKLQYISGYLQKNLDYVTNYSDTEEEKNRKFATQILEDLETNGEAFIHYNNFKGTHINWIKYSKERDQYFRTFYNAGNIETGTIIDEMPEHIFTFIEKASVLMEKVGILNSNNINIITPALKYAIKKEYGIENIIYEDIKESTLSEKAAINSREVKQNNKLRLNLSALPASDIVVNAQKKSNCGTRSIRELLRDNLSQDLFRDLYNFITTTSYSQMLQQSNLEMLQNTQEVFITKEQLVQQQALLKQQQEQLEQQRKLLKDHEQIMQSYAQGKEIYAQIMQSYEQERKISILAQVTLDGGFSYFSKQLLLHDYADKFASKNKIEPRLAQNLWIKMFEATLKDRDLPLPTPMLELVQKKLKESISEVLKNRSSNELINERLPDILKNWRNKCLVDPKIDIMIKAPIIKGMLNDNSIENPERANYHDTDTVAGIHKKLQQEQKLSDAKTQTINRNVLIENNFPKTKEALGKAIIEGKLFQKHFNNAEQGTLTAHNKPSILPIKSKKSFHR